ncbi:MAG: amidohydrolase family protein [Saprospiraceae bacterium]|nr:amidohydrolase family protein [Saprospiraceae bacterium]
MLRLFFLAFCGLGLITCQNNTDPAFSKLVEESTSFDILIQGGRIIDGTGAAPFMGDVLIKGDEIAYIGQVDTTQIEVKQIIPAAQRIISPGFIDAHAHGNPVTDTSMTNFLAMGVTTILLGQDGASPNYFDIHIPGPTQWLQQMARYELQPNIAYLLGHGTLRRMAEIPDKETPTVQQQAEMNRLLGDAIAAGFYGMSTGLEYVPGLFAEEQELIELAKVVGEKDGLIMSHMRNEDDDALEESIDELIRQGAHCRVHIAHLKAVYGKGPERAQEILDKIDKAQGEGVFLSADVYPYMASYTGIGILFPDWSKTTNDFTLAKQQRPQALRDYLYQRVQQRNGPEATLFGTGPYAGKTLAEVAKESNKSYVDILMEIGPNGASGAYFIMDESLQEQFIASPIIMYSTDGSPKMRHPRGYGSFAKIIQRYVGEKGLLPLELAIRKMTELPATTIGISKRGRLAPGFKADVLVFDETQVKAQATYDSPYQLSTGFDFIIVNGKLVRDAGQWLDVKAGKILRKQG